MTLRDRLRSRSQPVRASLRVRLLVGTLAGIAVAIAVAGWALGGLFQQHVAQQLTAQLTTHLDQLTAGLGMDATGAPRLSSALSDPRFRKPYSGLYWQVDRAVSDTGLGFSAAAEPLRSRSLWDDVLKLPADTPADGEVHQHRIPGPDKTGLSVVERVVTIDEGPGAGGATFRLAVAADERQMVEPIDRFNGMLWLALGLLGAGLALVAVVQVMIALLPLRRLRGALAAVREGRQLRLEGSFPSEVQPLVEEFNSVLAENAAVVERARTQAGNLAHALKTPLSVMANATNGRADEVAQLVAAQVEVARKQVDYHLSRSRVAASARVPGARTPVRPVLDGLVRVMRRIHAGRELELEVIGSGQAIDFRGEEQDLQEMLGNLLDNACKWARHRVAVSFAIDDGRLALVIDDDGAGIAGDARERVLDRGERADEQVPGSGLGLAIVDDLAHLYDGWVELADSPLGGLRAVLILPVAAWRQGDA